MEKIRFCTVVALLGLVSMATCGNISARAQTPPNQAPPSQAQAPQSATPATTPVADYGRLRVYRAHRYVGSALAPTIYVNGIQVARVGSGRRVSIRLTPGQHSIRSDDKNSNISLDVKAGQDYYVRVDEETGFWKGHGKLTLMMPEQGGPEYKLQKPIEDDRKIAREMIEDDTEPVAEKPEGKDSKH